MRLNMEEKHRVRGLKTSKKGKNDKDIKPLKMQKRVKKPLRRKKDMKPLKKNI